MDEAERRRLNSEEDAEVFMTDKKTDKTKRAPRATGTNRYVPEFSDASRAFNVNMITVFGKTQQA